VRDGAGKVPGDLVIEAHCAGGDVYLGEGALKDGERVFVLVPLIDKRGGRLGEPGEDLGEMVALERRAEDEGRCGLREDVGEETLGLAPVRASEVGERGAGGEEDGVDAVLLHELAGAVVTGGALVGADGMNFGAAVAQGEDGCGQAGISRGGRGRLRALRMQREGRSRGCGGQDKAAAREHGAIVRWAGLRAYGPGHGVGERSGIV
jgi:hypothetical protein